jgi:hypothetical protein
MWGKNSSLTLVATATSVASASPPTSLSGRIPEVRAPGRLDLFSDRSGTFSS